MSNVTLNDICSFQLEFEDCVMYVMQNTEKPVQMVWDLWGALIGQDGSRASPRR